VTCQTRSFFMDIANTDLDNLGRTINHPFAVTSRTLFFSYIKKPFMTVAPGTEKLRTSPLSFALSPNLFGHRKN
jgi:hypothetical protein